MPHPTIALPPAGADPLREREDWARKLQKLLEQAAELSAKCSLDGDLFMTAAWDAYLAARPGLREELEESALRAQLEKLRKQGAIGSA